MILKTSGLMACLLAAGIANATGLGGISVSSNLGQPLRAEIELVSVDKADRSSIAAKLAVADAFKRAGLEYPYALPRLKFDIVARDTDQPRIRITSTQPINEPFVTLLVEVVWSSGKLLREYTFLLDPVGFDVPAQPAAVVSPVAPVVPAVAAVVPPQQMAEPAMPVMPNATEAAAESAPAVSAAEGEANSEKQEAEIPVQASVEKVEPSPAESVAVREDVLSKEESIPLAETPGAPIAVVRGDTLSKIALKTKPADVSLERMLLALYRANTGAFMGKNMNRLQAGKVIRLPDAAEIEAIDQKEAVQAYRAQVTDWNAYRQQLAAARGQAGEQAAQQSASGKVTASVAETAPAVKETAKEVLKLSKGEVPGDKAVGGKSSSKEEDAIAREKSLQDAQERTALLEKNVKDLQRLADLKQQQAATPDVAASAAAATTAVGTTPAVVKPAAKPAVPAPLPVPEKPAPSFLDELLDDPVLLGGGAAVLLLLLGGGFWLSRRRTIRPAKTVLTGNDGSATGRITAPVMPSPETGDFTQVAAVESAEEKSADEVDPIAEADLFLSFGRDTQAEEVLKDALSGKPGDLPILLKLLAIYANRKDASAFFTYANQVKASGNEQAWEQVAAMGRALEPNNPLYGGAGESTPEQLVPAATTADPAVDFDLGFGGQAQPTDFMGTPSTGSSGAAGQDAKVEPENLFETLNVNIPQQESTTILSPDEIRAAQGMAMDFDVTGTQPQAIAASTASQGTVADDLIFDVTSTHPGMMAGTGTEKSDVLQQDADDLIFDVTATKPGIPGVEKSAPAAADDSLAFTLEIPDEFKQGAETKTEAPMDIGLGEISLNLGGVAAGENEGTAGVKDEHWQEVATKLDLAKAYQEMGDAAGAREILDEVLRDGDEQQRDSAQAMLAQL